MHKAIKVLIIDNYQIEIKKNISWEDKMVNVCQILVINLAIIWML